MIAETGPVCNTEEMFDRLVMEYQIPLKKMCFMYLRDMALAEDAVQETFLKIYKGLNDFREESSLKTWVMRIGMNTCRDMLRSAWLRHTDRRIQPEELQIPEEADPGKEEADALGQAIMKLPPRYKDVILLYYYQDMSQEETAEALRTSVSSVSRRLKHARGKLRDIRKGGQEDE
jgi:RNA polymerase sigma-70 factor (ECF subfamily)